MTDKEQIIKNNVNVNECIDFNKRDKISCYHLLYDKCDEVPNCYFKQLARKTQECEKLKEQLMQKDEVNTFFNTPIKGWSDDPCEICPCKNELQLAEQLIAGVLKALNLEAYDWHADQNEIITEMRTFEEKYEALKLENQEGYEIVDELKQECEELKKELDLYKTCIVQSTVILRIH